MTMTVSDGRTDGGILRAGATASSNCVLTALAPSLTATTSKAFRRLAMCIKKTTGQREHPDRVRTIYLNVGDMKHVVFFQAGWVGTC